MFHFASACASRGSWQSWQRHARTREGSHSCSPPYEGDLPLRRPAVVAGANGDEVEGEEWLFVGHCASRSPKEASHLSHRRGGRTGDSKCPLWVESGLSR